MSLATISRQQKDKVKHEPAELLKVLIEEYEEIKKALVHRPIDQLPELRGQAKALESVIKLLS